MYNGGDLEGTGSTVGGEELKVHEDLLNEFLLAK
jgi:hypothetical protein